MWKFESSQVSQPVWRPETLPSTMPQRPANGRLLRIGYRSPGSGIGLSGREIAESLRRIFEIFPFLRESGRRLGTPLYLSGSCNFYLVMDFIVLAVPAVVTGIM
jgi:hypothetical protein